MRDHEPIPLPDDEPDPPDPFEADLVAYLDGELDPADARRVEARLAADPAARARADALQRAYDLLDYLPRHEPSPDFTSRTLERLPTAGVVVAPPKPGPVSQTTAASLSVPVLLTGGMHSPQRRPAPRLLWAAGVAVAIFGFAVAGYLVAAALQPQLFPRAMIREGVTDDLPLSDRGLIEQLPLYAAADDIDFVHELAKPDCFGDDPIVSFDPKLKVPAVESDQPPISTVETLVRAFKELPPARQQAIRELHRQLNALDPAVRNRLVRVLEGYRVWLDGLPEAERRGVLGAATPLVRLGVIRDIRDRQWLNALPPTQQAKLTGLDPTERGKLIQQWKADEARRRGEWEFARRHAEAFITERQPWPFDTEAGRREIPEFMRAVFRYDDPKRNRLSPVDLAQYREALDAAQKSNEWAWYGKAVYELMRKYETLPEPAVGEPVTTYAQLGAAAPYFLRGRGKQATNLHVGKWPDFALAVHAHINFEKGEKIPPLSPLGPAQVSDFKEPVRTFWEKELSPKLTPRERDRLRFVENRWPEYPREFILLARQHDLSVPGVMLPGSPRKWETIYGTTRMPGPLIRP